MAQQDLATDDPEFVVSFALLKRVRLPPFSFSPCSALSFPIFGGVMGGGDPHEYYYYVLCW